MTVTLSKIALVLAFPHINTKITSIRYGLHARKTSPGVWREATRSSPRSPGGVQNFSNSSNKRSYAYLLTPEGVAAKAELTRDFLARKIEEYDALRLEIERLKNESEAVVEER